LNAGKMDKRITIQNKTNPSVWGTDGAWSTFCVCYAKLSFQLGNESNSEDQEKSKNTGTALIRHNIGIKPKMRIVYGERIFDIISIVNVREQDREMVLEISEVIR
jgi:SPP1 family predicted phage head-tail adaptor